MISHSYPSYNEKVINEAYKMLQKGDFSARRTTLEAKYSLGRFMKSKYTELVSSGFTALQCALIAVGIKKGEEVIIPNVTCPSVFHAVKSIGALPKVIDVGEDLPLLSDKAFAKKKNNLFVIVANMFGIQAPIIKENYTSTIFIEDNSQCFSSCRSNWSDITTFSFSPTKLFTIGYGGAVITNNEKFAKRIQHFLDSEYILTECFEEDLPFRIHSDIADFQSAMLLQQLNRYDEIIDYRLQIQKIYDEIIQSKRLVPKVPFRYQLILEEPRSEEVSQILQQRGINAVPLGSHLLHEVFALEGDFSNSVWWKKHVVSLPIHEAITIEQVKFIANEVKSIL